ncbi:MAG: pyridoxamine 5'-phosphate oxidase family protein [Pseudomonadota bacterium]
MPAPFADAQARDAFLREPRLAILMMNRAAAAPIGVPVWFEWTGSEVLMFAAAGSPKVKRISKDPNVSVLVTNHINEAEAWVAFDGQVTVQEDGVAELIGRLGARYWDLSDPAKQAQLDSWVQAPGATVLLQLSPVRIRSGA